MIKKSVFYWSPCLSHVGTVKSTLNSAVGLAKYNKTCQVGIINVFGEWDKYTKYLNYNNVEVINLTFNYYDKLPRGGFLKSRLSYLIIILISCFPLFFLILKRKPDYLIAHLITSLPLILFSFIKTECKLILRISGYPKLNFFRQRLWKFINSKIFKVTCPTNELYEQLDNNKIFDNTKTTVLSDAIININEFLKKKNEKNIDQSELVDKNYFLSVGRFTRQKNYSYLVNEFEKFIVEYPNEKLVIIGEGELKQEIVDKIKIKKLDKNIKVLNYSNNIEYFMKKSKALLLPSLWEDPGFVLVEAAMSNTFVISSDCKNGPKEFLLYGKAGILFKNNQKNELYNSLNFFIKTENDKNKKKILAKKNCLKFTMFRHQKRLSAILNEIT